MKTCGAIPSADTNDDMEAMQEVIRVQRQLGRIRKVRDWTLDYVGNQLNVHPSTVWRWENNPAYARNISELQMYARFLGYTLRVLVIADNKYDEPQSVLSESPQNADKLIPSESGIS